MMDFEHTAWDGTETGTTYATYGGKKRGRGGEKN